MAPRVRATVEMQASRISIGLSALLHVALVAGLAIAIGTGDHAPPGPPPELRIVASVPAPPPAETAPAVEPPEVEADDATEPPADPPIAARPFAATASWRREPFADAAPLAAVAHQVIAPRPRATPDAPEPTASPPTSPPDPPLPVAPEPNDREAAPFVPARALDAENTPPRYPVVARRRGWQGVVWLALSIDATGRVTDATVAASSGYAVLDAAARGAALAWRFEPATRDGAPVASERRMPIEFRFTDED